MRRPLWRRVALAVLVVLLVAAGVLAVGLTGVSVPTADGDGFRLDLAAVRALAVEGGGALPREVRIQEVGRGEAPRALVVAGGGLGPQAFHFVTYQLVWEGGRTVVVDPVADEATMRAAFGADLAYDAAAWAGVQRALRAADAVVVTHEHFDHAGGLVRSPHLAELAPRAALTPAQLTGPHAEETGVTAELRARLTPLEAGPLHRLRPGVVLVRAPGHTPGSQLVYVRRADGVELLLVGDVAWTLDNLTLPRMHPRLVSWLGHEDGAALAQQLGVLHRLRAREPGLHQVVSHDGAQAAELVRRGVLTAGLR